jgi:hypothetical protein
MADRFWMGPPPSACDMCDTPIKDKFYDAVTTMGPWANMCPSCFTLGPGRGKLGTGFGQEYTKIAGSCEFKKTGG